MKPRHCLPLILLASVLSLSAGTFTNDFNSGNPPGTSLYGTTAFVDSSGGPDGSGCLKITTAATSQSAGFILDDLDAGAQIRGFTASFQLMLGGGDTPLPADGFSFNFGNDIPDNTITEEGVGTNITVEFDTYENSSTDLIGIDLKWRGVEFVTNPMDVTNLVTWPTYVPVTIQMTSTLSNATYVSGTMTVSFNGTNIYTNAVLSGFQPLQGRFGLGARTGGSDENCWLDNLGITTVPVTRPYVLSDTPTGTGVRPDPIITVQLYDAVGAGVDPASIHLTLNGISFTPTITQASPVTTVQLGVPVGVAMPPLASGSSNWVVVTFADNSGSPTTQTNQFGFVVANYPPLPLAIRATADTSQPGFTQRIFQGGTTTVASVETAETMLAGLYYNTANGQLFPNTAQTNTDGSWTYVQPGTLNYNIYAPTNTTSAGDFANDVQYPGMPGTNGSLVNFAYEAVTYLYLTSGVYTFGVNSDDGFRVVCGAQVGVYDAGRGAADTLFSFGISAPGYYPFRLVHFQGSSAASLEFFSVTQSGQKILINDTSTAGYIRAYAKATTSLPYFTLYSLTGAGNRPDKPVQVEMQDGVGITVNTNTIQLTINGAAVAPSIARSNGVTLVQYSGMWASGSANTAVVWFADSQINPWRQTNQFTFSASTYATIPASYAIGAVDLTKPGFAQQVFQTDRPVPYTIANAETMLAGQLFDAAGNPYPNKAAVNTDGSYNYPQANVINYNIAAPAGAGDFTNDTAFPGIPGASGGTNTFALGAVTYLYLPVGYYVLGVNSDDGFLLTTSPNPYDQFAYQIAVFDGTRGAADTTGGFGISQAGYYPFRLVYFQATGPASLELFNTAYTGARTLVNDTDTSGSLRGYRSANNTQPYVAWAYPYRATGYSAVSGLPVSFTLVDGTPAVQLNTIQMTFNGAVVSPSVARANGTNIVVSYWPAPQTTNSTPTVQLVWADASGHYNTNAFSFTFYGSEALAPLWNLPPAYKPYLTNDTTGSAQEAGMAYNPVTSHLIVGSLLSASTLRGFYVLDALTGNDIGQLAKTNAAVTSLFTPAPSFVDFAGYSLGVADDGVIYAATKKISPTTLFLYNIYRWGSETSAVSVAFSDSSSKFGFMLGWDFRVHGAGTNTQIIAGAGNGSSGQAVLFTTADGTNFTAATISPITGVNNDLYGGIAFGTNNTFYAEGFPASVLEYVSYDPVAKTGSALASYIWDAPSGSLGPLGVDLANGRVIALATSTTAGTAHTVNLFDLNALTNSVNYPVSTSYVPTSNANPNGSGSVVITPNGAFAFVLDTQNGIMAYELTTKSTPSGATPARIMQILYGHPYTISGTGPVSHPFALVSSTNVNKALNLWTPEQTNTAGTGAFSFSVMPGSEKGKYFRVITQ